MIYYYTTLQYFALIRCILWITLCIIKAPLSRLLPKESYSMSTHSFKLPIAFKVIDSISKALCSYPYWKANREVFAGR